MRPARILLIVLLGSFGACRLDGPQAQDARPIFGCYVAQGAPSFVLNPSGMLVGGTTAPVHFRYVSEKVGPGLLVPLKAVQTKGRLSFERSVDEYFYRRMPFSNPPVISIVFSPDGKIANYRRVARTECAL